jgi:hypothetical protein
MRTNPIGALYAMVLSKPAMNLDHDDYHFSYTRCLMMIDVLPPEVAQSEIFLVKENAY